MGSHHRRPAGPASADPAPDGRRTPRRRGLGAAKLVALLAVVVGGGVVLYPHVGGHGGHGTSAAGAPGDGGGSGRSDVISVRYKAGGSVDAPVAQPWFEVVNESASRLDLGAVTLRYYFTDDGAPAYEVNCVQASVDCSNVSGTVVALAHPTPTADHYLEVSFSAGSGSLAPGGKGGAIGLQLYRPDGRRPDQSDDRSYDAHAATFRESKLVTGYVHGRHVWGDEPVPSGGTVAAEPPPTAGPRPAPPSGVVFDDFHYTGPGDPALHAHGWLVRTSPGGPGVLDTWTADGVSFPAEQDAAGGQVLTLRAATDGTRAGTRQSEVQSSSADYFTGTYAARIYYTGEPVGGRNGDPINESFYMISPDDSPTRYSELDYEYEPNGGWGAPGPRLDTVSWYSARSGDRVTRKNYLRLQGWHTMVITAAHGTVTYSVDGRTVFTSSGRYYPREKMSVDFNTWFVDLPFRGQRSWDMKVNWFYYNAGSAMSLTQVQQAVNGLYGRGTHYVNTVGRRN